jgi:3D (Asp-Asp-Asp) domain-containing protein
MNVSGHDVTDLSNIEVTFSYRGNLSTGNVWGAPSMNWQVAQSGTFYTLTGGTTLAAWNNGTALTIGFTAEAVPTNVHISQIIPPPLVSAGANITQNSGTITVTNTTGAPIPLRKLELDFSYAGAISMVWGSPSIAWHIAGNNGAYVFTGGTQDTTQLAPGAALTVGFTQAPGVSITNIVFKAAIGAPPTPFPAALPAPTPTLPVLSSPIPAPSPQGTCVPNTTGPDVSCVEQRVTMYGGQTPANVAFPQIHYGMAGGTGTYLDPITFAADPTIFPEGSTIYVPYLSRYFIMEDLCPGCMGATHTDLWMGGTITTPALTACATSLSGNHVPIIENPRYGYAVITTPLLWDGQNCFQPAAFPPPPFSPLGSP